MKRIELVVDMLIIFGAIAFSVFVPKLAVFGIITAGLGIIDVYSLDKSI